MRLLNWNDLDEAARERVLRRGTAAAGPEVTAGVAAIIEQVRRDGDTALLELGERFDGAAPASLVVPPEDIAAAAATLPIALRLAITEAAGRIRAFHEAGRQQDYAVTTADGVDCRRVVRPIRRVGLYVPAGSAPLPSTALMLGVPAQLAGCPEVVLCTPPGADGRPDRTVLAAAAECGIGTVVVTGGAQAVAAMAHGTESVPRCDKIFGPGNAWVTEAKRQVGTVEGGPGTDLPAGPSEVVVIADGGADPEFVAADLLSQAEHGPDSQVLLLTDDPNLAEAVLAEVERQVADLPRAEIARKALAGSAAIVTADLGEAFVIGNDYAPEHLILALRDAEDWLDRVERAGSVFLGDWSPETLGDYCSGTNHVLPTAGAARWTGGVSVASFQVAMTVQRVSRAGLAATGPCAVVLSEAEGLHAHQRAVTRRLDRLGAGDAR
jgi:histidinol dehydrogenase